MLDILLIPVAIGLWFLYQRSLKHLVVGIISLGLVALWTFYFTDWLNEPVEQYRNIMMPYIADFAFSTPLPFKFQRGIVRYCELSIGWSPLAALILPFGIIQSHGLWDKIFRAGRKNKDNVFKAKTFDKNRNHGGGVLIGMNKDTKKPAYLYDDERVRHVQVLGSTGFGKTESVLLPMIYNDIRRGRGLIALDAKADENLLKQILVMAQQFGREDDVLIFSPDQPKQSWHYNPLKDNEPTVNMNKLVASLEWSEVFYKHKAESALLTIFRAYEDQKITPTIHNILDGLKNPKTILTRGFQSAVIEDDFRNFSDAYKKSKDDYAGLIANLEHLCHSEFGAIMSESTHEISIKDAYLGRKIVIIQASTLRFPQTAKILGKLVLNDIQNLCGFIYKNMGMSKWRVCPVYVDEFGSFAYEGFADFIRMGRGGGLATTLLHQTMGDLETVGPGFTNQIMGNTNIKIFLKSNDNTTVEEAAKMTGTKELKVHTYQVDQGVFNHMKKTGLGSEINAEEFKIHPNVFRDLKIGEAVLMVSNNNRLERIQLDHFNFGDLSEVRIQPVNKRAVPKYPTINQEVPMISADNVTDLRPQRLSEEIF
ncbi:MAG: TraM recognition domain-containing protein [Deltaproteobacteria bacterium]|nr:TraM recognition domain-containing protein [Deltaproteobacteria bacterium]